MSRAMTLGHWIAGMISIPIASNSGWNRRIFAPFAKWLLWVLEWEIHFSLSLKVLLDNGTLNPLLWLKLLLWVLGSKPSTRPSSTMVCIGCSYNSPKKRKKKKEREREYCSNLPFLNLKKNQVFMACEFDGFIKVGCVSYIKDCI